MFTLTITTTRPDTSAPFFPNSPAGRLYEETSQELMLERNSSMHNKLVEFTRVESTDHLTLTTTLVFENVEGRKIYGDTLLSRLLEKNLLAIASARELYNQTVNHVSTVEVKNEGSNTPN
jgi:hypothetical protein